MDPIQLVKEAGVAGYVVAAFPGLSLPVLLVLAGLSLARVRVPAPVWLLAPVTALLVGHVGVAYGNAQVTEALRYADPSIKSSLLAGGISESYASRLLAQIAAMLLFTSVATLAAVSGWRAGDSPRWTPTHAIAPVVFALLAAAAAVPAALGSPWGWMLVGIAPLGAVLLAVVSARTDDDEANGSHGARMGTTRVVVGAALFAAAVSVYAVDLTWGRIETFRAIAFADPSVKAALLAEGMRVYPFYLLPAVALLGLAGASAVAPAEPTLDRRALIEGVLCVGVLLVPGLVRLIIDVASADAMAVLMGAVGR